MAPPSSPRAQLLFGGLFVLIGLGLITAMTVSPAGLNVPYWVGVAAASTFSLAGLSIALPALGLKAAPRFIAPVLLLGLAAPGLWIMLAPDVQSCSVSGTVSVGAGDFVCRAVFGFGGLIVLAVAVAAIVALFVRRRKRAEAAGDQPASRPPG